MQEFMRLDRNLKLRTLTVFLAALLNSSVMPNMTIYYSHYFGAATTGLLLMIISVVSFVAGLYGGHLADVHGRKTIMMTGSVLLGTGFAIATLFNSPLITEPALTFIGFFIAAVGGSLADPAEQAMMIDSSTTENRKFVYALVYWVINISVMLGAAIGGWFFRDYLFELLLAMIAVSVINLGIIKFGMTETFAPRPDKSSSIGSALKSYVSVLTDHRYSLFLIGLMLCSIVTSQPDFYFAVHLGKSFTETHLFGIAIYGQRMLSLATVINTVIIVFTMTLFTRLSRNWPLIVTFALGIALQTGGFAFAFLTHTFVPIAIAAVVLTIGEMFNVPASQTIRADMMNPEKVGAYSGAISAVRPVASVIAGGLVSISGVIGNVGMALAILFCGIIAILIVNKSLHTKANF